MTMRTVTPALLVSVSLLPASALAKGEGVAL
jgi:hypothetical protein